MKVKNNINFSPSKESQQKLVKYLPPIKITYFLNDSESSISFLPTNRLATLKNMISISMGINFDDYDIYYAKKKIDLTDDNIALKEIVGRDQVPVFFIKSKSIY